MWYIVVFQPSKCKKFHFQPQIWFDLTHFPKWLRKSAKSLLYKTKKLRKSDYTQKFWAGWSLCLPVEEMSDVVVARTVEMFSCWCGEHFLTMSSYAKHVNLHARGEYKPDRIGEEKQEEETSSVLVSNEKERRPGKEPTFVQKKESVRGAVGMDQELEAAVKRMDLVSKTSTTSDTFMTAKSCQESDRE